MISDGDYLNSSNSKTTNPQIIVVQCCDDLPLKKTPKKLNLSLDDITGDRTNLTTNPSLVNLAKLVQHNECLIPLSSWEHRDYSKSESDLFTLKLEDIENSDDGDNSDKVNNCEKQLKHRRHSSLAGRISNFFRKHWGKSKTLVEPQ